MTVTIPQLSLEDLIKYAQEKASLTHVDSDYAIWDFKDDAGKIFEVLLWSPKKTVTSEEVRAHFKELEAEGNVSAFIAWVAETKFSGHYASIPFDDSACWRHNAGGFYVPYSDFNGDNRWLDLCWYGGGWRDDWSFVGFRIVN